jgi:2-hydroxy-6-oxonona-2,4-dienedioate hydrolase
MVSSTEHAQAALASRRAADTWAAAVIQYPLGVGNVVTRVLESGVGPRTVLCLHGAGSRADRWAPVVEPLAAIGYRVLALDFPGHGLATKGPAVPCTTPALSDFVAEALDALGLREVDVLGTSLGGHVGATLATRRPGLVRSLVLVGAVGIVEFPLHLQRDPKLLSEASPTAIRRKLEVLVADRSLVTDAWVREESMINSSPGAAESLRRIGEYLNDGLNGDLVGALLRGREPLPTLLVWGADDVWVPPEHGRATQVALPGTQFVLMERCGHAPYFEWPQRFVEIVGPFLGDGHIDLGVY